MSTSFGQPDKRLRTAKSPPASAAAPVDEGATSTPSGADNPCPRLVDDAELTRDLDRAQRLVRLLRRDDPHREEPTILRFDSLSPTSLPPASSPRHVTSKRHSPKQAPREEGAPEESFTAAQFWSWTMITLGLMAFVCGGVLLACSLLYERDHFWRIGLPLVLGGQAALILGLVLQMEGLWQSTQQTSHSLDQLDDRLDELQHATTTLSTTHTPPAATFYAHYAQGASPHLLLADLKGQLDLLATKLAEQRK